jgi:hypothetical protein
MKIILCSNRYLNHWINHTAIFAICIGFGLFCRIGFMILDLKNEVCFEIQLIIGGFL